MAVDATAPGSQPAEIGSGTGGVLGTDFRGSGTASFECGDQASAARQCCGGDRHRQRALDLELSDFADACPIATVALEVASTDEVLRIATATVFGSWHRAAVERFIAAGVSGVVAHELATLFVAALKGRDLINADRLLARRPTRRTVAWFVTA